LPIGGKGAAWAQQIFVDNTLQFLGIAPTFALYPQKMRVEKLKFYFRPQPVDNSVDNSFLVYLVWESKRF
jgi:hypothetical protein